MKDLGITKGEWVFENYSGYMGLQIGVGYYTPDLLDASSVGMFEAEHNADLCCDAGNTAQECGILPSELLQQRDEMREIFERLIAWHKKYPPKKVYSYYEAPDIENALTKIIDAAQAIITKAEER